MRTALYARVSTEEQAEKYGLPSQLTELRDLAARKGYTVPDGGEFVDEGHSGATLDRPALNRLRDTVRAGAFQVVLVHDPDRLSRRLAHQLLLIEEFEAAGVRLEFLTVPKEDTPEGRLLLSVKGVIAEYEREKIKERTLRGKREKARRGLIPAGPVPYGYRPDPSTPGKLIAHEEEAAVVRMMYRRLTEDRWSIRAIVTELREQGIRPPRSRVWAKSSVRRILTSEMYAGRAHFNRRDRAASGRFRAEADWIAIAVPAIVTPEVFRAAQRVLGQNRAASAGHPPVHRYLLRGLLVCGECGRKYYGTPSHGRPTYRCSGRDRLAEARCHVPTLSADSIEAFVWGTVVEILKRPDLLAEKLEAHRAALEVREIEVLSEVGYLRHELVAVARKEERLLDAFLDEDGFSRDLLRERLDALQAQKAALGERLARAERRAAEHEDQEAHHDAVRRYCQWALRGLDRLSAEGRHQLLKALVDQIVVKPGNVLEIHGVLPGRALSAPSRLESSRMSS